MYICKLEIIPFWEEQIIQCYNSWYIKFNCTFWENKYSIQSETDSSVMPGFIFLLEIYFESGPFLLLITTEYAIFSYTPGIWSSIL